MDGLLPKEVKFKAKAYKNGQVIEEGETVVDLKADENIVTVKWKYVN